MEQQIKRDNITGLYYTVEIEETQKSDTTPEEAQNTTEAIPMKRKGRPPIK